MALPRRDERGRFVAANADYTAYQGDATGMGKFATELQEATKSLGNFDKVTEQTTKTVTQSGRAAASGGRGGRSFAVNTAAKIGRQTVRAAGFDLASFAVTQGVGALGNAGQGAGFSFFKGIAQNPTMSKALDLDLTLAPIARAGQRTLGITGAMARLGASPEEIAPIREALMQQFGAEEMRAAQEARAVELLERSEGAEKAAAGAGAKLAKTLGPGAIMKIAGLDGLSQTMRQLDETLRAWLGSGAGGGGR